MTEPSENTPLYGQKEKLSPHRRLMNASRYSYKGLRSTFYREQAFRFEIYAFLFAIPLSTLVAKNAVEYLLLLGSMVAVMIVELLNTGIELIVDRVSREHHELSGRAKDAGSAAVFLMILVSLCCWIVIFIY